MIVSEEIGTRLIDRSDLAPTSIYAGCDQS